MLGAAAALDAGVGLERGELREIGSSDEAEVFVSGERRNFTEASAGEEDGGGAEYEMQVLGVRNDWKKNEESERVSPPEGARCGIVVAYEERGEVRRHENEYEQCDEARFPGKFCAEPARADEEAPDEESRDARGAGECEGCSQIEIEAAEQALGR